MSQPQRSADGRWILFQRITIRPPAAMVRSVPRPHQSCYRARPSARGPVARDVSSGMAPNGTSMAMFGRYEP